MLALLLALLGVAAYGSYIQHAGFVTDDWSLRKVWLSTTHGGQLSHLWPFLSLNAGRPALGLYFAVVETVLGFHQGIYLALALANAILFSITVYLVLRALRVSPLPSGIIAALTLVFPGSDSLRLWGILGDASYAMTLLLLGLFFTLRSFDAEGRRRVALRSGGLALYALSLATYEIGMVPLAISFVLYRCRVPWRQAIRTWLLDLPVIVLIYVLATRHTSAPRSSTVGTLHHGLDIARDALKFTGAAVLPFGGSGWVALGVGVAVIALAAFVAARLPAGDPARSELRRWLVLILVASLLAAASYAVYAPGWSGFTPLDPGLENRVNALGAPLLIAIAYALGALAGLLMFRRLPNGRRYALALAAGFGVLLGGFYFVNTRQHAATWKHAYDRGEQVLYVMTTRMPKPKPYSLVVSFDQPTWEAPDIPIWATSWDLDGAVAVRYHDLTLNAIPAVPGTTIECGPNSAGPVNRQNPGILPASAQRLYGHLYLFSTDGRWIAPRSRRECLRAAPTFIPGPWFPPPRY